MQVFIIGTPLETAMALDKVRLNKQIIETYQILSAIHGETKAWANHPVTIMYSGIKEVQWLVKYLEVLEAYRDGEFNRIRLLDYEANIIKPPFHTKEYFDQMKRRLYTKDPNHYRKWANLGVSEVNWYYVNREWRYYHSGKQINYKY